MHPGDAELARLEWQLAALERAAPARTLDVTALAAQPPDTWAECRLRLSPRAAVFRAAHPVYQWWSAHSPAASDERNGATPWPLAAECLLITAAEDGFRAVALDTAAACFYTALVPGAAMFEAVAAALAVDPGFDFSSVLRTAVRLAALCWGPGAEHERRTGG